MSATGATAARHRRETRRRVVLRQRPGRDDLRRCHGRIDRDLKVGGRGLMTASVTVTVYIVAADVTLAVPQMVLLLALKLSPAGSAGAMLNV
jgi:hypothetical protein